jgi:hypothetical protein
MILPFAGTLGFERLPGDRATCYGLFKAEEIEVLLLEKEKKVLGTAARFLEVPEVEIVKIIPMSSKAVGIFFSEKEYDLYDYGDDE